MIDMNKPMRSQAIDEAIRGHYGSRCQKELTKWRDDIVAGNQATGPRYRERGWARKFTSSTA